LPSVEQTELLRRHAVAISTALTVVACARPSQGVPPDRDLVALLHGLVIGAVDGGGRSQNDVFVPADSTSASIMRLAEVPIHASTELNCPGSTNSNGDVVTGLVGYVVRVSIAGAGDTRVVSVRKSCTYVYRGRGRGFFEALDFEVMRRRGHWSVTRRMNHVIT
jgi:hypothetical protein